jgi:signal recognition particle receptor subunit beta
MVTINRAFNELGCKLVYYGPGMGGKTTNLELIHGQLPQNRRGDLVSLATESDRTLFFDFLPLDLGDVKGMKTKFQLFTVPGQVYYNATRKLVLQGVDGIVFVADSQRSRMDDNRESLMNLRENLAEHDFDLDAIPWILQYNKRDLPDAMSVEEMNALLNPGVDFFCAVALQGEGVKETLKDISIKILTKLRAQMAHDAPRSALENKAAACCVAQTSPELPSSEIPLPSAAALNALGVEAPKDYPKQEKPATKPGGGNGNGNGALAEDIVQKCDVRWHGLKIGSARLELKNLEKSASTPMYQLEADLIILGCSHRRWRRQLALTGEEWMEADSQDAPFYILDERQMEGRNGSPPLRVRVKKAIDKSVYLARACWGGRLILTPAGKPSIF